MSAMCTCTLERRIRQLEIQNAVLRQAVRIPAVLGAVNLTILIALIRETLMFHDYLQIPWRLFP